MSRKIKYPDWLPEEYKNIKWKYLHCYIQPYMRSKPVEPKKTIVKFVGNTRYADSVNLGDELPEGTNLKDIVIYPELNYDDRAEVVISIKKEVENEKYEQQLVEYNKNIEIWNEEMKLYRKLMRIYKKFEKASQEKMLIAQYKHYEKLIKEKGIDLNNEEF